LNEARAFLWPRLVVALRLEKALHDDIRSSLSVPGVITVFSESNLLVLDISHWQLQGDVVNSVEFAIARLQHLFNLSISPLHYSLGISSDPVMALHAANSISLGQEKWVLPWQFSNELQKIPVSSLRILHADMPAFFSRCGKSRCAELGIIGKPYLQKRFGTSGEKLWCLLHGKTCNDTFEKKISQDKISWSMSLPVRTRSTRSLSAYLWRLYNIVNKNLDRLDRRAGQLELNYLEADKFRFRNHAAKLDTSLRNRRDLTHCIEHLDMDKNGIALFQITASRLSHPAGQLELF